MTPGQRSRVSAALRAVASAISARRGNDFYFTESQGVIDAVESASPEMENVHPVKMNSGSFHIYKEMDLVPDDSPYWGGGSADLGDSLLENIKDELEYEDDPVDISSEWKCKIRGKKILLKDAEAYDADTLPPLKNRRGEDNPAYAPFSLEASGDQEMQDILDTLSKDWLHVITEVSGEEVFDNDMQSLGRHWAHDRGSRVIWVDADKILFMEGNTWDFGHAAGVKEAMQDGKTFEVPPARVYKVKEKDVEATKANDENGTLEEQHGMTRPWDDEDVGSVYAQLIDGNHRAAAAIALGDSQIPVYVGSLSTIDDED